MWRQCADRMRRGLWRFAAVLQMIQNPFHDDRVVGTAAHMERLEAGFKPSEPWSSASCFTQNALLCPRKGLKTSRILQHCLSNRGEIRPRNYLTLRVSIENTKRPPRQTLA